MNIIKMHEVTFDNRTNKERAIELKRSFLDFKETREPHLALNVIKNCLSLVNDVLEYSKPIRVDAYYKNYAKSFIEDTSGYFNRFEYDHNEFLKNGLNNDLAPRFYCKDWFSTVVGVLEIDGMLLNEIEEKYYAYLEHPNYEQTTIFDFVK